MMNVTGVMATSGNLYTLIVCYWTESTFIGGRLAGDSDESNSRLNINFGYYF